MGDETELTEYELRRLENIKRNQQMLASLNVHSPLSNLKRLKASEEKIIKDKTYKQKQKQKQKQSKPRSDIQNQNPIVIRRSLRARGMPPDSPGLPHDFSDLLSAKSHFQSTPKPKTPPRPHSLAPLNFPDVYHGYTSDRPLLSKLTTTPIMSETDTHGIQPIHPSSLTLRPQNIARVVPGKILAVRFFPSLNMTMVVAGNKFGHLGFWDVKPDHEEEEEDGDGIYLYQPHSAPISGISLLSNSKVYTSSYDGLLRSMDTEKEVFDLVYSSTSDSALFSLSQHPNDANNIYFGEGQGDLNMLDARVGKISDSWSLHEGRINSVDFNCANTNILATSSTDGLACLWDIRKMDMKHPESKTLQTINHGRAVHSAYFSPSGSCLATTSLDDNIGVLRGVNFEETLLIHHNNWTNRWISSFRAVWGWDETYLFIGNMKRRVDVLSVTQRKTVYALESPLMSAIPCRYDAHPCEAGLLAGATSGGQVYLWSSS